MSRKMLLLNVVNFCVLGGLFFSAFSASPWDATKVYSAAWKDTVTYTTFEGNPMYWINKWWIEPADLDTPGCIPDSGGTSGWMFLNTVDPYSEYQWEGCTGSSGSELKICIPTWKDGAKGGYTLIHDDICSMDFNTLLKKADEIAETYGVKVAYGVFVGLCDQTEYDIMLDMVNRGHEILCHSYNHHSASQTWQWFWHGDQIPSDTVDPSIPPEWALLILDTSIAFNSSQLNNPGGTVGWNSKGWNDDANGQVKMIKLFCYDAWTQADYYLNVDSAKALIDKNVYDRFNGNKYFPKGKKCEYYVYPYDAYSNATHDYLDQHGFIAARGGSKCSVATSGDFYHPYRSDFDSYYDEDMGVYPNNPHMWLTLQGLVDGIINHKGYMIRELHAVAGVDQYWGAVTEAKYDAHLAMVKQKMESGDIANLTPSEAIKQRLTTNACETGDISSGITVVEANKEWLVDLNCGTMAEKYKDEITIIAAFPTGADDWNQLAAIYESGSDQPRMQPKKLGARRWAVYVHPYKEALRLIGDATTIDLTVVDNKVLYTTRIISFLNGKLIMSLRKGDYTASLMMPNGRIVGTVSGKAGGGYERAFMNVDKLSNGFYILHVKHSHGELRQRVVLAR